MLNIFQVAGEEEATNKPGEVRLRPGHLPAKLLYRRVSPQDALLQASGRPPDGTGKSQIFTYGWCVC